MLFQILYLNIDLICLKLKKVKICINDMKFTSTSWNDLGTNNEVFYSCIFIY